MVGSGAVRAPAPDRGAALGRSDALRRLADEHYDVVVVGGGVTGCGAALDAAARGLRTALVEAGDIAGGTSSRSSKLVHGGLRYLAQHDYRLVQESLAERQRLLANAPHLVHPLPFVLPLFGPGGIPRASIARAHSSALWLYDLAGGLRIGRRHRRITAAEALRHVPSLRSDRLGTAFMYWDAQADDARLTLALARTAASMGAAVASRAPVARLLRASGGGGAGRLEGGAGGLEGVALADGTEVRARVVINATGVWSAGVAGLPGGPGRGVPALRPAKGVHVVVRSDRLPCDVAAVLPVPGGKRSVFVVPWWSPGAGGTSGPGRYTYIGTTDTDYDGPLDEPRCGAADVDQLLGAVNAWTDARLTPDDVTGTWAGLRPLLSSAATARSADLSRRHAVTVDPSGLVTVTGGKLTTYRKMAADAVDAAVGLLAAAPRSATSLRAATTAARSGPRRGRRSPTARLRLFGAGALEDVPAGGAVLADPACRAHLHGRYGTEAAAVAALCEGRPDLALPLVEGMPYLRAEAVFAARSEMALTVEDVLARRTRALVLDREAAAAAAPETARLLGSELGWDAARVESEASAFAEIVAGERRALERPAGARS